MYILLVLLCPGENDSFNPFYPEGSADVLQPVPDHFLNLSAINNYRPSFKMDITLLYLN